MTYFSDVRTSRLKAAGYKLHVEFGVTRMAHT